MNKPISLKAAWPFALASFTIILGPLLLAWFHTPAGYVFSGTLADHNDFSAFLAAMRQGADGNWLFHFNFSPERWHSQLMLPLYMILGKLLPGVLGYAAWVNVLRVAALGLALWMFGLWVKQIFPDAPTKQWTAWLFLAFGGGLGWLLWPLTSLAGLSNSAALFPDLTDAGWALGLIGANAPHYMLGLFLEILFFLCFWQITQGAGRKWVWAAAITALALCLIYVYNATVLFAVVGLYMLWRAWDERRIPWRTWITCGSILAITLPFFFYYGYWVNRDPAWAQYVSGSYNRILPPSWYSLLLGAGIVGILAFTGIPRWWKTRQNPLPIVWIVGNLLVMYVPIVQYSGRFIVGLWVPLATLAAYGLEDVVLPWLRKVVWYKRFSRLTPTPYETLRRIIVILTVPSCLLVALIFIKNISTQHDFPLYMPESEIQAMNWLAKQTDPQTDLVLAYYPVGNYFPVLSDTRVFMGQFFLTVDFDGKVRDVEKFWRADTPDIWRQALIKEWHITYIYQGKYENALDHEGITPPGILVYDKVGVKIYRTTP
jgi:hypothetical protein